MKRKILVILLVFAFLGLGSIRAEIHKPDLHAYAALGIGSFETRLYGTKADYFSPSIAVETFYSHKSINYGIGLKCYFANELTFGFMPVVKYSFLKDFYLKVSAGREISFLSEAGRAVYRKINTKEKYKMQLWVEPERTGWTGFLVVGLQGQGKKFGVEAGVEYRELKAEFSIDDVIKETGKANIGILVRLTFKLF